MHRFTWEWSDWYQTRAECYSRQSRVAPPHHSLTNQTALVVDNQRGPLVKIKGNSQDATEVELLISTTDTCQPTASEGQQNLTPFPPVEPWSYTQYLCLSVKIVQGKWTKPFPFILQRIPEGQGTHTQNVPHLNSPTILKIVFHVINVIDMSDWSVAFGTQLHYCLNCEMILHKKRSPRTKYAQYVEQVLFQNRLSGRNKHTNHWPDAD